MRRWPALLWLLVVLAAIVHVAMIARHGLPLESDIMALLPREDRDHSVQAAKDRMVKVLAERVVVLVGHAERDSARRHAALLRQRLVEAGVTRPGSDIPSDEAIKRLGAAYFPHHAGLLADADRERLADGRGEELVTRALSQIFGFAGPADARLLARDPFLLFPAFLGGLPVPGNRLVLDDGMLGTVADGTTWIMVNLTLAGEPYALDFQQRFIAAFDAVQGEGAPGLRVLRLGALFYAHAGADQAMEESSRIGIISLIGTVLLVVVVFRSVGPLLLSVTAIAAGLVVALSVCLALFGSVHVAAQLFGASLIGIAVDYALLYFGRVFAPRADPARRLAHILPGMVLGMATTVIGYASLALSPFPGLKQVALFSAVGLVGSFLTVVLWFPLLDRIPSRALDHRVERGVTLLWRVWTEASFRRFRQAFVAVLVLAALVGLSKLQVDDDVRHQQGLSPALAAEQAEIRRLVGFGQAGQFFLVEGENEQQVLEREEELAAVLAGRIGWQSVARYIPSAKRQAANAALVEDALNLPHLGAYRARLGMAEPPPGPMPEHPLTLADIRATGALPVLDVLVLNQRQHVVNLDDLRDVTALRDLTKGLDGIRLIDPAGDFSVLLGVYRYRALALLALSGVLMAPLLAWRYGWRGSLRLLVPAGGAIALTPPLVALAGVDFSFFAAMALVMVLSIGTDYGVFCAEDRERDPATLVSIFLAMVTTLLSFGLLAFSEMVAVRAFGATMLVGVFLAFMLAPTVALRR